MVNTYLFWAGGAAPDGWTLISDSGNPFYHKFVRGAASYDAVGGGSATHTHTIGTVSCTTASTQALGNTGLAIPANHEHNAGSTGCGTASNLPAYQSLKVIKYTGIPGALPAGVIAIFDAAPPVGWTESVAYQDKFIYCSDAVATGGSNTHTHTISGSTSASQEPESGYAHTSLTQFIVDDSHSHAVSANTVSHDNVPTYLDVRFAELDGDGGLVIDMIAMFDATPPSSSWSVLSGVGGAFNSVFIRGAAAYGGTGGTNTHTPANQDVTTGGYSDTGIGNTGTGTARTNHTHTLTLSFGQGDNTPPYIDVIIAKYLGPVVATASFCEIPKLIAAGML